MHHPMPYRILWTWDSWICDPFSADSFRLEYRSLIDFLADAGYNGLIIWGFVDDRHGGIETARDVAAYGAAKGVRVIPGIGAGGYGGFVTSTGHPYHLETFLREKPHLRAHARADGKTRDFLLCLYQPEALDWLREGMAWLASECEIGGINVETNEDAGIDVCTHARTATEEEPNRLRYPASFYDLSVAVPVLYEELRRVRSDAWVTYATYSPMWWDRPQDCRFLERIPPDSIAQWNTEMALNTEIPPPAGKHVSLIHSGGWSYPFRSFPPVNGFTQYRCFHPNLAEARAFCRNQRDMGLDGIVLGNAGPASMPDNEIAYHAYIAFSRDPDLSIEEFSRAHIGPLYGTGAEPLVLELMRTQARIQGRASHVWKTWAGIMAGSGAPNGELPTADSETLGDLESQLRRARDAMDRADPGGKKRLETILQVLTEYTIIATISRDPFVERFAQNHGKHSMEERILGYRQVEQKALEAGLPRGIYQMVHVIL